MAWQVSPVQNSEMVLYCRLIRLKNVVAGTKIRTEVTACYSGSVICYTVYFFNDDKHCQDVKEAYLDHVISPLIEEDTPADVRGTVTVT